VARSKLFDAAMRAAAAGKSAAGATMAATLPTPTPSAGVPLE
jgi:hypothetical protein